MQIDGSMADMSAIITGIVVSFIRPTRRFFNKQKPYFISESAITDVLNGVTIVPFMLMIGSVFSTQFLDELLKSAKITLAIGGVVGMIFIVNELKK